MAASAYPTDCAKPESRAASTALRVRKPNSAIPTLKAQPLATPRMMVAATCTPGIGATIRATIPARVSSEPSSSQPRWSLLFPAQMGTSSEGTRLTTWYSEVTIPAVPPAMPPDCRMVGIQLITT